MATRPSILFVGLCGVFIGELGLAFNFTMTTWEFWCLVLPTSWLCGDFLARVYINSPPDDQ